MLSHGNIVSNVASCQATGLVRADDVFLSFLPLSHMFERTGGYYLPLSLAAKVVFARSVTLLPDDLKEQQPTVLFAVPRIFEKFHARLEKELAKDEKKQKLFRRIVEAGWAAHQGTGGLMDHFMSGFLRGRAAKPVLDRLGGKLRLAVVGGAALDPAIAKTFIGLGLTVLHGYGMTEAAPVVCVNRQGRRNGKPENMPETVGPPLPGVEVQLSAQNELLVRGPNVMLGYWQDEAATARVLKNGWLHTGDLAEMVDGRVAIRGRLKDILVLSNGEKLPPQDVELAILSDDVFEQGMLVGEGKPFLSLIVVSQETDERQLIKRANERLKAFPRYVRVRRVVVSQEPWTVDNGLVTPTLKVKRAKVMERFAREMDAVYADGALLE
jgi:long-chain acyl-CoA synthetase